MTNSSKKPFYTETGVPKTAESRAKILNGNKINLTDDDNLGIDHVIYNF